MPATHTYRVPCPSCGQSDRREQPCCEDCALPSVEASLAELQALGWPLHRWVSSGGVELFRLAPLDAPDLEHPDQAACLACRRLSA
jgi:hypothetical protein